VITFLFFKKEKTPLEWKNIFRYFIKNGNIKDKWFMEHMETKYITKK
jgi:hypothetical protein